MLEENSGSDSAVSTRDRLLKTAIREFGLCGYEAVSTRALAEAADVNQAAIPYHFSSKEGLYVAAARYVVDTVGAPLKALSAEVAGVLDGEESVPRGILLELLQRVLGTLARVAVKNGDETCVGCFIIREQLRPGPAFDIIYEGYILVLHRVVTRLIARLEGLSDDDPNAIIKAHGLLGQALIFCLARATIQRRMGWSDYTPQRVDQIVRVIDDMVVREAGTASNASGMFREQPGEQPPEK